MLSTKMKSRQATLVKHLIVAFVMALIGAGLGTRWAFAESKSVWVPGTTC